MGNVVILLLDSFGIGASLDAADYGDEGSDTFGHIVEYCYQDLANKEGLRHGPLKIPNLIRLGLARAAIASRGEKLPGIDDIEPSGLYGYAITKSRGKDTPSGHWELAGIIREIPWGIFPNIENCFPNELLEKIYQAADIEGTLANCHAGGITVIDDFGQEHLNTKKPIFYTSEDSVLQIAAHEEVFGLEKLYNLCEIVKHAVEPYNIGRVIARPFIGEPGKFKRTSHRKDYSKTPSNTLLNIAKDEGYDVMAVGKVSDIFANSGITTSIQAYGNMALVDATIKAIKEAKGNSIIFTNISDFDTEYGHRRDVAGYANALEEFDQRLPEIESILGENDCAIITADHGCDPSFKGAGHTKEHLPVLMFGPGIKPGFIGRRETLADIGQTIASSLKLTPLEVGVSFIDN